MDLTRVETRDAPPVVQFGYTGASTGFFDVPSTSSPGPELTGGVTNREFESVIEFRRMSPIAEAFERLEQIEGLGPNWDSYGSQPPTQVALETARRLIGAVYEDTFNARPRAAVPYSIVPLSGGGVQVEWRGEAATIEVEISSEGVFGYLLVTGSEPLRKVEEKDKVPQPQILELVWSVIR